jgi:hypothetical protein
MPERLQSSQRRLLSRLRGLHHCQTGGVQSLALVMTLPLFIGTILLVIQLCQVLMGVMTVQYAAFAAARAAVVWIPSSVEAAESFDNQNSTNIALSQGDSVELFPEMRQNSRKLREIHAAAAQACVAISPSRTVQGPRAGAGEVAEAVDAFLAFEQLSNDARLARWRTAVSNRWSYAFGNTRVRLAFLSQPRQSPTYNPIGHPVVEHRTTEAAWDESVTIAVRHEVALVPGPGRWLFQRGTWGNAPQNMAANWTGSGRRDRVPVLGSATLTLAGIKSNRPFQYESREN